MNEPNEDLITPPTAEEQKSGICVWYDRKTDPDMLFVSIPLAQLAENKFGSVFLRGYLEEVIKGEALFHIRNKILKKAQSGVIVPKRNGQPVHGKGPGLAVV